MALTQVGSTVSNTTLTATVTLTKPTGVAEGDLLIAFITSNNAAQSAPSGDWVNFEGLHGDTLSPTVAWQVQGYYKYATASEPSTYSFGTSDASGAGSGGMMQAWRGVDPTTPFDGSLDTLVTQALSAGANSGSPSISVASTSGRVFGIRAVRRTSNGGSTGTFTPTTTGTGLHSTINSLSGSGNTLYAMGWFSYNDEYTTSGSKGGIASQFSLTQENQYRLTYALKAAVPASGSITSSLPKLTSSFAAERELPEGEVNTSLPKLTSAFVATGEPPNGDLIAGLPKLTSSMLGAHIHGEFNTGLPSLGSDFVGAVNPIGGFTGQLGSLTALFTTETSVFGEHVIRVEKDHRAFRVVDDGTDTGLKAIKRSQVTNL